MAYALLQEYLANSSKTFPGKDAVVDDFDKLSYKQLDELSNRLARCLIRSEVPRGGYVLLCMRRSVQYIVAILGILKADAPYVPIDPRTPEARLSQILKDCRPFAIVCDTETARKILIHKPLPGFPSVVITLDSKNQSEASSNITWISRREIETFDADPLEFRNNKDDTASILYTSGSTGVPKGVMISHRNINEYVSWAVTHIGISEEDRILGTAPFFFDMSLFDVFCSLKVGATLCIATERTLLFPARLIQFAEAQNVTVWKGISSLLMYLARTDSLARERLPTLKTILFSGEPLPTKYLIQWMRTFPQKTFYNAYGPTEATGISMYYRVDKVPKSPDERIPIGKPCENTEVFLLDEKMNPVPKGEPGEIFIKGICLAKGYLNDPQKTKEAFIEDPLNPKKGERVYRTGDYAYIREDGNYVFLGRKDDQIKLMGYRIELCDVEQAIISIDGVHDAAAVLIESNQSGFKEMVAYVEMEKEISLSNVMRELKKRLPHYMIPNSLIRIERIPRSSRGKIDRQALLNSYQKKAL